MPRTLTRVVDALSGLPAAAMTASAVALS